MNPEVVLALTHLGIDPSSQVAKDLVAGCALIDGALVPFTTPTAGDDDLRIVHQSLTAACVMASLSLRPRRRT